MTDEELEKYWKYELEVEKPFWDAVHAGVRELLRQEAKEKEK